ncbi:unnamed protein product [Effrenium voratum]|uniref:Uncharacterized protein n=1 Tax=Effrenium voratum TaxID=2562239 RepID=A0AA36N983_9DINO|nr:unnamed protein product [Effrenium voratum]
MDASLKAVVGKFQSWMVDAFGGSGDPQLPDAVEICPSVELSDYFQSHFGDNSEALTTIFKSVMHRVEQVDPTFTYSRKPVATNVPDVPELGESLELNLMPWHLSFDPSLSLKGKSKMVYIKTCVTDFLERPYNSMENPIHVFFPKKCNTPGQAIQSYGVGHGIGFAKSLAIKMLLLGVVQMQLSDAELKVIAPQLKALFSFRCLYKTLGDEKQDRIQCLKDKFGEAARPRPDCIQVCTILQAQAREEGAQWEHAAARMISEFNKGSTNEVKQLSDLEMCIVKVLPSIEEDTLKMIDYHWQNHAIKTSALPYKVLATDAFMSGSKPKPSQDSKLWRDILSLSNEKRHWYITRKIRLYLFKIADAKRLRRKVSPNSIRDERDNDSAWAIACIFTHFQEAWSGLVTQSSLQRLQDNFCRGYLDTELLEKYRLMNPSLAATSFRFLAEVGYQVELAADLQKAELAQTKARLLKEQRQWMQFNESLEEFKLATVGMKQEHVDKQRDVQRAAIEDFADLFFPVRDLAEISHGLTFAEASIHKCCGKMSAPQEAVFKVYWLNSAVLGYDAVLGVSEAVAEYASHVASSPASSCILVAAPTAGAWGSKYHETAIVEATEKVRQLLQHSERRLLVREVCLPFQVDSIQAQSKRPGMHKIFLCVSDQCDASGQPVSKFTQSQLWKRQIVAGSIKVPMAAVKQMVDPRRSFVGASGLADNLSKPSRRKQWLAGWQVTAALQEALWSGMGQVLPKASMAAWVDVFMYDHFAAEGLMRAMDNPASPDMMYIGLVWADMSSRDPSNSGAQRTSAEVGQDNAKICKWVRKQIRRKLQGYATEGALSVPGWEPITGFQETRAVPQVTEADFTLTYPAASNLLPLRSCILETLANKFTHGDAAAAWAELVSEHNAVWNPSGTPHEETKKRAASEEASGHHPNKKAKVLESKAGQPASLEELIAQKGAVVDLTETVSNAHLFFTDDGEIWALADSDTTLSDRGPPLALVYGTFKLNEEASTASKKSSCFRATFNSDTEEAVFRKAADSAKECKLRTLRSWLNEQEQLGCDIQAVEFACHSLKPGSEKDSAGDTTGRVYEVQVTDPCVFLPSRTPRKVGSAKAPDWEDAGSLSVSGQATKNWNLEEGTHNSGNLSLKHRWLYSDGEQGQTCNPEKPGLFPSVPLQLKQGILVQLA